MKRFFRRLIIKSRMARVNAHLNAIQREREMLDRTERFCIREANRLQLQALNLDIRARRHA
jgi:hypothetical protein